MQAQEFLSAFPIALTLSSQVMQVGFELTTSKADFSPQSHHPPVFQIRAVGLQVQTVALFLVLVYVPAVPHLKHV
jgi:hypothetical protein